MVTDISLFFEPLPDALSLAYQEDSLGSKISMHLTDSFPGIPKGAVVIFDVQEYRASTIDATVNAAHRVRQELFKLKDHFGTLQLVDLGTISQGDSVKDTYYAVSSAVAEIVKQGGIVLILGGSQDISYANYLAYEKLEQVVNLVLVDSRFDLGDVKEEVTSDAFLQKIILHQPNILFNYSILGYQTHHVSQAHVELMKKMYFDIYRLGEVQSALQDVEPVVRNADILSFDASAVRTSDHSSNYRSEPNGIYGEEACAILRYAGLSDKLTSVGIYNVVDPDKQSAQLIAQMIWYFLLGVSNRKRDYPFADKEEYTKYIVTMENGTYDVVFYKSGRSDRWWMEVPYPSKRGQKYERHFMVPCNYADYQRACSDEIPDRWWQTYQKLG